MRALFAIIAIFAGIAAFAAFGWSDIIRAQQHEPASPGAALPGDARSRAELGRAQRAAIRAEARAKALGGEADAAQEVVERTQRQAAALAARIQQAEAAITVGEARLAVARQERAALDARLAAREQPLVRLTAALQMLARRPLALSALQPASLKQTVYLRAALASMLPQVRVATAELRTALDRRHAIEAEAQLALGLLRSGEQQLATHRRALTTLEGRQRIVLNDASEIAARAGVRALALAENARDIDALVDELDRATRLREELAALPGPIARPALPGKAPLAAEAPAGPRSGPTQPKFRLQPPVEGRAITGYGEAAADGLRARGVTLSPRPSAQVVAPAAGRVAFSGPYRGFGQIVIIEHGNGWTSLVTGLARSTVETGAALVAGSPLGVAASRNPAVTLELRHQGNPVNPLQYM